MGVTKDLVHMRDVKSSDFVISEIYGAPNRTW